MTVHQADREGWLIPAAVAFLAACVIFAVVMLLWHGGIGNASDQTQAGAAGTSPAAGPASPAASPRRPSPTPNRVVTVHQLGSGLCLDVKDGKQGAKAVQQQCQGGDTQRWTVHTSADGTFTLVNVASGMCLDVTDRSVDDNAKIQQWTCNGGTNQQWQATRADSAGAVALVSVGSGKCLDVPGASHDQGAELQQHTCNGSDAQRWALA
ncbi:MAG: RICIN domain-containing protein [Micromonosporaceae bacterium]|nr:RICIN domain-containing protein [Micromonosporaceae bacterium]